MPLYDLYNLDTDEFFEELMSYSQLQTYLADNPHIVLPPAAPAIISGIAGVTHKNDGGFKDMMNRIARANPYSPLAEEYGEKSIKESKTRDAVRAELQRRHKRSKS